MPSPDALEVSTILIGLFGGLALFLFGMEQMTDALKSVAGGGMKRLLERLTRNRFSAAFAGAFVTAVIQSSSVTTVLVVGFISAGLLTFVQSIGVIMGANVGTTVTAQIIAFKITKYALVLVATGFALKFLSKKERVQQYGLMVMGLGLVFFGMELMSGATRPLRSYEPFINLMQQMENPAFGILVSAAFTGLIQSSSATTGVIIVLASQGFITLEAGIALVFGANIGTCVTALLAALGKPREAVQAAAAHVFFNIAGVLLWLGFIDQLAFLVREMSPAGSGAGMSKLASETPRQIANAHTIFNIANTFIFIWFTKPIAKLIQKLVPEKRTDEETITVRYLDELLLDTPALALDRARMELRRLSDRANSMVSQALSVAVHGSREDLKALAKEDEEVDILHKEIVTYLGAVSQTPMPDSQKEYLSSLLVATNNIESIGDMVETNIVGAGLARLKSNVTVSNQTEQKLSALHKKVAWAVELALQSVDASDPAMARQVFKAKSEVNELALAAEAHLAGRLTADASDRFTLFKIESEIIEYLKRVYYFAKRIAKAVDAVESELI